MTRSPTTPAAVTGINYPSPIEFSSHYDHFAMPERRQKSASGAIDLSLSSISSGQRLPGQSQSLASSTESTVPSTPADYTALDDLWRAMRAAKEVKMAKEPSKVESFDLHLATSASPPHHVHPPLPPPKSEVPLMHSPPEPPTRTLKKKKSVVSYYQRGNETVVIFDMQGLSKQDIHVSYQREQIVVTWDLVEVFETFEDGHLVRERREKTHTRTISLPEGTSFSDVKAGMGTRHLQLRFPSSNHKAMDSPFVDEY